MTEYTVTVSCCLCSNDHKVVLDLPAGWGSRYGAVDDEQGFCPEHSQVAGFSDEQCPGCVGGWGDCDLWSSFAYSHPREPITAAEISAIRTGLCPRRTNGTFTFSRETGMVSEDLSKQSESEAGAAFADGIIAYLEKYGPDRIPV